MLELVPFTLRKQFQAKTGSWYFLGVLVKITDEDPILFL